MHGTRMHLTVIRQQGRMRAKPSVRWQVSPLMLRPEAISQLLRYPVVRDMQPIVLACRDQVTIEEPAYGA